MGVVNCRSCSCSHKDQEGEVGSEEVDLGPLHTKDHMALGQFTGAPVNLLISAQKHVSTIVRIQTAWRAYQARKLSAQQRKTRRDNSNYFSTHESKDSVKTQASREERPAYTFESGVVYKGQWRAGMRDGQESRFG